MKNDNELIKLFQEGSSSAFDELVRRHLESVYGFFIPITGNAMDAEDIAQEVFIKLFKSLKKFRFDSDFKTYLYRAKINAANSFLRKKKWKSILHLDQAPDPNERDQELEYHWRQAEIWDHIIQLPKSQRMVVFMRIAQSLPYKDIALILGISEGSAKVNFHHGINKIKESIRAIS